MSDAFSHNLPVLKDDEVDVHYSGSDDQSCEKEIDCFVKKLRDAGIEWGRQVNNRKPGEHSWGERFRQTLRDSCEGRVGVREGREVESNLRGFYKQFQDHALQVIQSIKSGEKTQTSFDILVHKWSNAKACIVMFNRSLQIHTKILHMGLPTITTPPHVLVRDEGVVYTVTAIPPLRGEKSMPLCASLQVQVALLSPLQERDCLIDFHGGLDGSFYILSPVEIILQSPHQLAAINTADILLNAVHKSNSFDDFNRFFSMLFSGGNLAEKYLLEGIELNDKDTQIELVHAVCRLTGTDLISGRIEAPKEVVIRPQSALLKQESDVVAEREIKILEKLMENSEEECVRKYAEAYLLECKQHIVAGEAERHDINKRSLQLKLEAISIQDTFYDWFDVGRHISSLEIISSDVPGVEQILYQIDLATSSSPAALYSLLFPVAYSLARQPCIRLLESLVLLIELHQKYTIQNPDFQLEVSALCTEAAFIFINKDQLEEAEAYLLQSANLHTSHVHLATANNNLGYVYHLRGKTMAKKGSRSAAKSYFRQSIELLTTAAESGDGELPPHVISHALNNKASSHAALGEWNAADRSFRLAESILLAAGNPETHPDIVLARANLKAFAVSKRTRAAVMLQSHLRRCLCSNRVRNLKHAQNVIISFCLSTLATFQASSKKAAFLKAAAIVQSFSLSAISMKKVIGMRIEQKGRSNLLMKAGEKIGQVTMIQSHARGRLAVKIVYDKVNTAAIRIQKIVRGRGCRWVAHQHKHDEAARREELLQQGDAMELKFAACELQRVGCGYLNRFQLSKLSKSEVPEYDINKVTQIQRRYRCREARRMFDGRKTTATEGRTTAETEAEAQELTFASENIQRTWKGSNVRKRQAPDKAVRKGGRRTLQRVGKGFLTRKFLFLSKVVQILKLESHQRATVVTEEYTSRSQLHQLVNILKNEMFVVMFARENESRNRVERLQLGSYNDIRRVVVGYSTLSKFLVRSSPALVQSERTCRIEVKKSERLARKQFDQQRLKLTQAHTASSRKDERRHLSILLSSCMLWNYPGLIALSESESKPLQQQLKPPSPLASLRQLCETDESTVSWISFMINDVVVPTHKSLDAIQYEELTKVTPSTDSPHEISTSHAKLLFSEVSKRALVSDREKLLRRRVTELASKVISSKEVHVEHISDSPTEKQISRDSQLDDYDEWVAVNPIVAVQDKVEVSRKPPRGKPLTKSKKSTMTTRAILEREVRKHAIKDRPMSASSASSDEWQIGTDGVAAYIGPEDPMRESISPLVCKKASLRDIPAWNLIEDFVANSSDSADQENVSLIKMMVSVSTVVKTNQSELAGAVAGETSLLENTISNKIHEISSVAASKIQAVYKGFHIRQHLHIQTSYTKLWSSLRRQAVENDRTDAAVFIQKIARGIQHRDLALSKRKLYSKSVCFIKRVNAGYQSRLRIAADYKILSDACRSVQRWWKNKLSIAAALIIMQRNKERRLLYFMERESAKRLAMYRSTLQIQRFYRLILHNRMMIKGASSAFYLVRDIKRQQQDRLWVLFKKDRYPSHIHPPALRNRCLTRSVSLVSKMKDRRLKEVSSVRKQRAKCLRDEIRNSRIPITTLLSWRGVSSKPKKLTPEEEENIRLEEERKQLEEQIRKGREEIEQQTTERKQRSQAATRIQSLLKGVSQRKIYNRHQGEKDALMRYNRRVWAATLIETRWRGKVARERTKILIQRQDDIRASDTAIMATAILQRWFVGCLCRNHLKKTIKASKVIQVFIRSVTRKVAFRQGWVLANIAAATIQRLAKCFLSHLSSSRLRSERINLLTTRDTLELEHHSATVVQCLCRRDLARLAVVARREQLYEEYRNSQARKIQKSWRGHHTRQIFTDVKTTVSGATTKISSTWKMIKTKREYLVMKTLKLTAIQTIKSFQRIVAAKVRKRQRKEEIQRERRFCLERKSVYLLCKVFSSYSSRRNISNSYCVYNAKILIIQAFWRGCLARKKLHWLIIERRRCLLVLQRLFRGVSTRRNIHHIRGMVRARLRQTVALENEVYIATFTEMKNLVSNENKERKSCFDSELDSRLEIIEQRNDGIIFLQNRRKLKTERKSLRRIREAQETASFEVIDICLTAAWKKTSEAWSASLATERYNVCKSEEQRREEMIESESSNRFYISQSSQDSLLTVRIKTSEEKWKADRAEATKTAERETQERLRKMSPAALRQQQWLNGYVERQKHAQQERISTREKRANMNPTQKCKVFKEHYLSRRLNELRGGTITPVTRNKQFTEERPTTTPASLSSLTMSPIVPLRSFASDWLKTKRIKSPQQPVDTKGSFTFNKNTLPADSVRRLEILVPQLALDSPAVMEADLSCGRLSDIHLHSLLGALKLNKCCRSLTLDNNSLSDVVVSALAEIAANHSSLSSLSLRCNNISDCGVASLLKAAKQNRNLIFVDLSGNTKCSPSSLNELANAISFNEKVHNPSLRGLFCGENSAFKPSLTI